TDVAGQGDGCIFNECSVSTGMTVVVTPLTPELRPPFERLLSAVWETNWDDELAHAIIRWRYYDRPGGDTWLLLEGERCVGMLDSIPRAYLMDGTRIFVREPADWFCLPDYRTGLGLTLLRKAMGHGEPLLVIGGSRFTVELLPRFRFVQLSMARYYVL